MTSQTIEPTQVAGFNQFYDDMNATDSRRFAIALDQTVAADMYAGVELSLRELTVPFDQTGEEFDWEERNAGIYFYWAPTELLALTAAYRYEEFSRPLEFPGRELITSVKTTTIPLGATLQLRNMFFGTIAANYVRQSGLFFNASLDPLPLPGEDTFWVTDMSFGYRLPRRRGTLSLDVRNVFDEDFQFQETDLFSRQFARERVVLFRASLAF